MAFQGMEMAGIKGLNPFDPTGDASVVSARWEGWYEEFDAYADSLGLFVDGATPAQLARRRALLLYSAGAAVREIFKTLPDTGEKKDYDKAVAALKKHFVVETNSTFQRHVFRLIKQKDDESIAQLVTRLRKTAEGCKYGGDLENQIRDQVVQNCKSNNLRRKLLEKGATLTLAETLTIAASFEAVETQFQTMKLDGQSGASSGQIHEVHSSQNKRYSQGQGRQYSESSRECFRCGNLGHFGRDLCCPARGKVCGRCGMKDHFAKKCKSSASGKNRMTNKFGEREGQRGGHNQKVRHVEDSDECDACECKQEKQNETGYAFAINNKANAKVPVMIGGVVVDILIDSGSDTNIVDRELWEEMKRKKIKCTSKKCEKKLYAYTSSTPLEIVGCFTAEVKAGTQCTTADFVVIKEKGEPLMSKETAQTLGVLRIGLNVNTVNSYNDLKEEFKPVFEGIGKLRDRQIELQINPEVKPVAQPMRRTPFGLRDKVKDKIDELIQQDIIEPVEEPTPWVSPVVVVPKPNGDIRLCIDMRRVNEAVMRQRHPIPTVDEILQELSTSKVFSKLDLKWGFHQLELEPESRKITTFVTHCGLYRYKRLLFGINAAPEIYQHEIHKVIQGVPGTANVSDDIIVHGATQEEHDERLRQTLSRLKDVGLTVNADKCVFGVSEMVFLGHKLTSRGIDPAKEKVKAVAEVREPQTATEVRSFLGLVNFCARFIPNFATVAEPLRRLTRKNAHFQFGTEQKRAFHTLKESLMNAQTLGYFDPKAPTQVIADASPVGLGAVLVQKQGGQSRIIAYASKSLTDVERRYSQTEKEALGLVWACEHFHAYLYGIEFELLTDHRPLEAIYGPKSKPCARIERWLLRIQQYKYKVVYIPGRNNIADSLSRLLRVDTSGRSTLEKEAESFVRFVAVNATPRAMSTREIEEESDVDPELQEIFNRVNTGDWNGCQHKIYAAIKDELCTVGKCVLRGNRIVIPNKLRSRVVALAHEGHLGVVGTKQTIRTKVWWPGLEKDVEKHVRACYGCQVTSRPNPPEPLRSTELPSGPWEDVAVDFLGPLPSGDSILVVIDYYSRYYEYTIMKSTTAEKTVSALMEIFARHGLPQTLYSDNGPQFISETFADYMRTTGVHHHKVTPKWPQANGEVERQNQSLEKRMRIAQAERKDWKEALLTYVAAYRATPHSTTGKSPAELLFGRRIRTKLPQISDLVNDQEVRDHDAEKKGATKLYTDTRRGARHSDVVPGDEVLVRKEMLNKTDTPFVQQPYTVVSRQGNQVTVQSPEGVRYDRNTSHVKKYYRPVPEMPAPAEEARGEQSPADQPDAGRRRQEETGTTEQADNIIASDPVAGQSIATSRPRRQQRQPMRFQDFVRY